MGWGGRGVGEGHDTEGEEGASSSSASPSPDRAHSGLPTWVFPIEGLDDRNTPARSITARGEAPYIA